MREAEGTSHSRPEFWAVLGGVRFALAAVVLCQHLAIVSQLPWALQLVIKLSAPTAVFCFLVLSGYSIAHSLQRGRHQFYRRRFLRVYPLYLLAILTAVFVAKLPGSQIPVHAGNVAANMLFLQTFTAAALPNDLALWSLALEVACYALAPFLQQASSKALLVMIGVSAVAFVVFPSVVGTTYFAWQEHGLPLLFLGWAWLAGFLYHRHQHQPTAGVVLLAGMVVLTTMNQFFVQSWQHVTIACSLGLLVAGKSIMVKPATRRVLEYLGNLSYPLYLLHMPVILLFRDTLHSRNYSLAGITSVALAMAALQIEPRLRAALSAVMDGTGAMVTGAGQAGRNVAAHVSHVAERVMAARSSVTPAGMALQLTNGGEL